LLVVKFALATRLPWLDPTIGGLVAASMAFMLTMLLRGASQRAR
jgi:hypothetical protein